MSHIDYRQLARSYFEEASDDARETEEHNFKNEDIAPTDMSSAFIYVNGMLPCESDPRALGRAIENEGARKFLNKLVEIKRLLIEAKDEGIGDYRLDGVRCARSKVIRAIRKSC